MIHIHKNVKISNDKPMKKHLVLTLILKIRTVSCVPMDRLLTASMPENKIKQVGFILFHKIGKLPIAASQFKLLEVFTLL